MSIKLVVVDDAPFMREVVRNIVDETDIQVVGEAANGDEAVKLVLSKRPDVVLMDLIMPEKSGIDATSEILNEWPEGRIVACSTESQEDMVAQAIASGCCNYVTKPFESQGLIKAIRSAAKTGG